MKHPLHLPRRRGSVALGAGLLLSLALSAGLLGGPAPDPAHAGAPTIIVLSATVVQARTPTPPGAGSPTVPPGSPTPPAGSATPGGASPTGTAAPPSATAVPSATAPPPSATAPALGGTLTAVAGTQTALAATLTALGATPSATRTAAPPATPAAPALPCRDAYEDDGVPAQAKPLVLGAPQQHSFCPAGDADWLVFFANAGKGYAVETSALGPGVDTTLTLFAPDARTVLARNDDAPGVHGPSQILLYPAADGWYFVQAKNQGDIGFPGATYTVSLRLVDGPTATATATARPTHTPPVTNTALPPATAPPTGTAPATWTALPTPPAPAASAGPAGMAPAAPPTPDGLLLPLAGGAGSGGLPVFDAGPADGMRPDRLEPNDSFAQAAPVNVGAVYVHLNFVPATPGTPDADFYVFRAKPGDCYRVQTGDLTPGLDTTLLLWQAAATREGRLLLAQNDDARPHTADLSSALRWCSGSDVLAVVEVHNYGPAPLTDPRGQTYSLAVQIDPPTPTPSPSPWPTRPPAPADGGGGPGAPAAPPTPPVRVPIAPAPPAPPVPVPPSSTVLPSATVTATATPSTTATATPTPTPTPSVTATATPTPPTVSVDVIAYVGEPNAPGPLQGDGIAGWPVQLVDERSNAVLQTTLTDSNGHARLSWVWSGPVWVEEPLLRHSDLMKTPTDPILDGPIYARQEAYPLPGIWP